MRNEAFMEALRNGEEELYEISQGVLCKIIERGEGDKCPQTAMWLPCTTKVRS